MADPNQESSARDVAVNLLKTLFGVEPASLIQTERLGRDLDFRDGVPYFERILGLFSPLRECNLDVLPLASLNRVSTAVSQALDLFKNVKEFNPRKQNPQQRDSLIAQARDNYDRWFEEVAQTISYAIVKGRDFSTLEERARHAVAMLDEILAEAKKRQSQSEKEVQDALAAIRAAAAEAGVSQQAIYFRDEAEHHRKAAFPWLVGTGLSAVAGLVFALLVMTNTWHVATDLGPTLTVQAGLAKLAIFSICYFGIVWCGRTYKSHRHNYVVNKHRQNALSTFKAFVDASEDNPTKNTVLIEAARCVFSPQVTGYLGKDTPPPSVPSQVLEVMRNRQE